MTPTEADALADRIAAIPGRHILTRDEWTAELADLDAGTVGTAIVRCLRDHDSPPTPRELRAKCQTLNTPANNPYHQPPTCEHCDGNGSIAIWCTTHPIKNTPLQQPYRFAFCCPACRGATWLAPPPNGLPATAYDPATPQPVEASA